jgi:pimeloyl-ACP methyl ester carboxylesterase
MPRAASNGMELEYDTFGDRRSRPLLLVMGLGTQMIGWEEDFCQELAERNFYVIRFDNRDAGLSTHLDGLGTPNLAAVMSKQARPPYTLDDMADDAAGLLDALGIPAAHVVGASMGGFVSQLLTIHHPEKVLTLTSIMSALGGVDDVAAAPEVTAALLAPPPADSEGLIEWGVSMSRLLGGPRYFEEERSRAMRVRAVARAVSLSGTLRQLAAIIAAQSRREALGRTRIPVLVLHGDSDPLVPVENGRRTAASVPGSRLVIVPGMGHDLPPQVWPQVIGEISKLAGTLLPTTTGVDRSRGAIS